MEEAEVKTATTKPYRLSVIKPMQTRQEVTYCLVAAAGDRLEDSAEAYTAAIKVIQEWVAAKAPVPLPAAAESLESYTVEQGGFRAECLAMVERGIWTVRLSEPDTGLGDPEKAVAGRFWTSDASLEVDANGEIRFSIRITCTSPADCEETVAYVRPGLVRRLNDTVGLAQERPLEEQPWILQDEEDLEELKGLLESDQRRLPVLLLTQPDRRKWTGKGGVPNYGADGNWLAGKTVGYAHIVMLPFTLGFEWTKKVGNAWSAYNGAVRVYMPGLNFETDSRLKHPKMFLDQILSHEYEGKKGARAFQNYFHDKVRHYNAHRRINWRGITFVPDARLKLADYNAEKISELTNVDEIHDLYKKQLAALRSKLEEAEQDAEAYSDDAVREKLFREHYEEENKSLIQKIRTLNAQLHAKTGKPVDEGIKLPAGYDEMADWVQDELVGRVMLHPRAVNQLKDADFEDPELVAKTLLLLANEYHAFRTGGMLKDQFVACCQKLHPSMEYARSISGTQAGSFDNLYHVAYPVGSLNSKRLLKWHLRVGNAREAKRCMRIYFFWDKESQLVVVGSLPAHLDNRMT